MGRQTFSSAWYALTLAAASAFLFARFSAGQQPSKGSGRSAGTPNSARSQTGAETYKFTANSNLVFLPTRVQSKRGGTICGLKPEQFFVEDNGVRQSVQIDEDPDSPGLSLVVLVQCGRSAPAEFIKLKGLGAMIDAITGDAPHEVAVVSFGQGPYVLGDFSDSSAAVRLALSRLRPCSNYYAASIDAVFYAIGMLNRRRNHYRRAILLISETRDHGSSGKLYEVVAELGITDTAIYSVAFSPVRDEFIDGFHSGDPPEAPISPAPKSPPPQSQPVETSSSPPPARDPGYPDRAPILERLLPPQLLVAINALRRNSASELASLSGGAYFNFATQRGFEQSLQRISNEIHGYYLLRFQPPSGPIMTLHTLRVRVAGHPDAIIQTRKNYWSGTVEASAGNVR